MKIIIYLAILIMPIICLAATLEVQLDGSTDYISIQTAVDASAHGDTVLVHPGTYHENINFNHHNITLASLYSIEPLAEYIHDTKIYGNLNSCIKVKYGETVTINGFTLSNNPDNLNIPFRTFYGGGIRIYADAQVDLKNLIITRNIASWGGGLSIYFNVDIEFGENVSIYDNISPIGMDIDVYQYSQEYPADIHINLVRGSVVLDAPDNFFILQREWNNGTAPPL